MDKYKTFAPVITIISFFILLFLYSKFGPSLPLSVLSQQKGEPLVVTETGNATAVPDIAKITLGITESGSSLKAVQNSVNTKSQALTDSLKKLGVEEKGIKTTSYNLYPEYDYQSKPQILTGYRLTTNYRVTIRDFDKVNDAIVAATAAGANITGGVSFEVNDETKNKALTEAREEAVAKAKEKAQSLAKAAGITLGKIINITEETTPAYPVPLAERAVGLGSTTTETTSPDINPGETEFTVTVSLSWEMR